MKSDELNANMVGNNEAEPRRSGRARRLPGRFVDFYPDVVLQNSYIASLIPNAMSATETNSQEVPSPLANIPPVNAETPQVLKMIVHSAVDKLDSILSKRDIQLCSLNPMSKTKIHQEIPWIKYPTTVLAFRRTTTRLFQVRAFSCSATDIG